ncbi:MAG: hypothetical protein K6B75_08975 [Lachnospiraceae bacterium]|nr:hypothetical protein [Lachnospiraceae bacterium]
MSNKVLKVETIMKREENFPVIPAIIISLVFIGILLIGKSLLDTEFGYVFTWWWTVFVVGLTALPLAELLFSGFYGGGYIFAKVLGIGGSGFLMFLLSSIKLIKFTRLACILVVLFFGLVNYGLYFYFKYKKSEKLSYMMDSKPCSYEKKLILTMVIETLFFVLLVVGGYYKCINPQAYGQEKMMDYAFMQTMFRTDYFPVEDMWAAGESLNYYYFGQYIATFVTKLSGISVNQGYNLSLLLLMALCFTLSATIVYELTAWAAQKRWKRGFFKEASPVIAGGIAGTAVTFAGNMHYTIFANIIPHVQEMIGMEAKKYWYPNATRYIGYNPDTNDKTIHEFPSYSFVLGDLHAHVTDIMFVLTLIGVLLAWFKWRAKKIEEVKLTQRDTTDIWMESFHPALIMVGFLIGIFRMDNFWDFPIYYVVSGAVILFSNLILYRFKFKALKLTLIHAVLIMGTAFLVSLAFSIHFVAMTNGIAFCKNHTPLYQLRILWGLPSFILLLFFISLVTELIRKGKEDKDYKMPENARPVAFFMDRINPQDLFVLTIGLCAFGLVLVPEVVYVRDIYEGTQPRANTMFKLTYQGYIMFGLMMGYVLTRLIFFAKRNWQIIWGCITACFFISTVGYIGEATTAWFGDVKDETRFQGLGAADFLNGQVLDDKDNEWVDASYDYQAINWINENISGKPVMVEAWGFSYSYYNRVSAFTGLPTIEGWQIHEWLWHNSYDFAVTRQNDTDALYVSRDPETVKGIIEKYDVEYIYIGSKERTKYPEINEEYLLSLGSVVYSNDRVKIIKIDR